MNNDFNFIPNTPIFDPLTDEDRMVSRRYLAASVKDRSINYIVPGSGDSTGAVTGTVIASTGTTVSFDLRASASNGNDIATISRPAVFIGDITTPLVTLLPGGSGVNLGLYRMHGPIKTFVSNTTGLEETNYENYIRVTITNLSGLTQTISVVWRTMFIINAGASTEGDT